MHGELQAVRKRARDPVEVRGPLLSYQVVPERLPPVEDVVDEEARRDADLGHLREQLVVGDKRAVLDAVPQALRPGFLQNGVVRVSHHLQGGVPIGVHHQLPAVLLAPGDSLQQIIFCQVEHPARVGVEVRLFEVTGTALV